jgi:hypothetical protein
MQITNASAIRSAGGGKITSEIRSATTGTEIGATAMSTGMDMNMNMTMTGTTTIDMTRRFRIAASGFAVAATLLVTPVIAANAADDQPKESSISTHAKALGEAVKRDAKTVGAKCKEGAHRVAVAAKAVGHEVATAAKRGAAETRAAFRGDKSGTPAS